MSKGQKITITLLPILVGIILVQVLWRQSYLLTLLWLLILVSDILLGKDKTLEFKIVSWGIIWGLILEATGVKLSGWHTFNKPDLLGVPLWLPVSWGYGFMVAKRIFSIIYTGSSFVNKK